MKFSVLFPGPRTELALRSSGQKKDKLGRSPQELCWVRVASGPFFGENNLFPLQVGLRWVFVNLLKWVQKWVKSGLLGAKVGENGSKPTFQSRFLGSGCDEALFSEKKGFSVKRGEGFSESGVGKDFYRKGNSVKRSGPFSEPPDSEN